MSRVSCRGLFDALDVNKDGMLRHSELEGLFEMQLDAAEKGMEAGLLVMVFLIQVMYVFSVFWWVLVLLYGSS